MRIMIQRLMVVATVLLVTQAAASKIPVKELQLFGDVYERIQQLYVDDVDGAKLIENAIEGMLSGLDPHSGYMTPQAQNDFAISASGKFGGLGITVAMENGFVRVIAPIDDTPAARAGIQAGDIIVQIDDTRVKGMTLDEAVNMMRGAPGTDIQLILVRAGAAQPQTLTLTRDVIVVASAKGRLLSPDVGYLRLTQFTETTTDEAVAQLQQLVQENKAPLKGLVLDLRNNPGGTLESAIGISDLFLTSGAIVTTRGRDNSNEHSFNATSDDIVSGAPIVALINVGSASAAEIVAGALQDHRRAIIIGERSFGKGSVQTVMPLKNGGGLRLTTARYYTPSGRSIQAEGIVPDIPLENGELTLVKNTSPLFTREANLHGHLEEANNDGDDVEQAQELLQAPKAGEENSSGVQREAVDDYVLFVARAVLNGIMLRRQ